MNQTSVYHQIGIIMQLLARYDAKVIHTSKSGSRYIQLKDGYLIRVADHQSRFHNGKIKWYVFYNYSYRLGKHEYNIRTDLQRMKKDIHRFYNGGKE